MTKLTEDSRYTACGVPVKVKILPYGTRWNKDCCGFRKGDLYKADRKLSNGTGRACGITVHNTDDSADAETYVRATFNQNMKTSRVHFYVDDKEAWQNLELDEVGWHAGTGDRGRGNDDTVAVEIIMGGRDAQKDAKSEENGARLVAYLLHRLDLPADAVVTHKHWSGKNCPAYILPHWEAFLARVKEAYESMKNEQTTVASGVDAYAAPAVEKAVGSGLLRGDGTGDLRLREPLLRQDALVLLDRLGLLPDAPQK